MYVHNQYFISFVDYQTNISSTITILSILFQKCKSEDPSLKTIFKTSLSRIDFKEKNDHYVGSKRGK